jgi:hypothetical protein
MEFFNVAAVNCDDQTKNLAFLMDDRGRWPQFANDAGVASDMAKRIARLQPKLVDRSLV